ncbi:hypothetical protein EC957_008327 [Mortierella hygrophila]|uniref:Uncharacterized protein n=1 Tax=Mortierella hygrophila TaxID=979708 RepID=A0A9P6FC85_9FUNG|nr:hypothetical protein EC957_008327 [Mortierella hygrophila]
MGSIPREAIRRHSHVLRVLYLDQCPPVTVEMTSFECTNLAELSVFVGVDGTEDRQRPKAEGKTETAGGIQGSGEMIAAGEGEVSLPHEKRLVRANPGIKNLEWKGFECPNEANTDVVCPVLDVEDFLKLDGLERLLLDHWDCSEGRLEQVLGTMAGTLKELEIGTNYGLQPELLKEVGDDGWVLDRLESIKWYSSAPDEDYLFELVKRCPNLRKLRLQVGHDGWDFSCLTSHLRTCCPKFDKLRLHATRTTRHMDTLIRDSSRSGFSKLNLTFVDSTDMVMSLILGHAATLKEIYLSPCGDSGDANSYLRLMVECTRLRRLVYNPLGVCFAIGFFRILEQQQWGCRELEEIRIQIGTGLFSLYCQYAEEEKKEVDGLLAENGWEEVVEAKEWVSEQPIDVIALRRMFQLITIHGLEDMKVMWLDDFTFRKVR